MKTDEICQASLTDLATRLEKGSLCAQDLLSAYLSQIDQCNGKINALIHVDTSGASRAAFDSDQRREKKQTLGVLDGIPIVVKDNIDAIGLPTTHGLGRSQVADSDAYVVTRLKAQGALMLGKANMDEAALSALSDNPHHGRVQHPLAPASHPAVPAAARQSLW